MKAKTISCLIASAMLAAVAATSQAQAQVSLAVGVPGFYGAIDIGDAPPPTLVYQQPVVIGPVPMGVAPLYLYVPPEQYSNWGAYCGYYSACDRPVYFIDRGWYQRVYVPHYRRHRVLYEQRRAEFTRYSYRPAARGELRHAPRPDNRRVPVQAHPGHQIPRGKDGLVNESHITREHPARQHPRDKDERERGRR
jgi:hypothetical protein